MSSTPAAPQSPPTALSSPIAPLSWSLFHSPTTIESPSSPAYETSPTSTGSPASTRTSAILSLSLLSTPKPTARCSPTTLFQTISGTLSSKTVRAPLRARRPPNVSTGKSATAFPSLPLSSAPAPGSSILSASTIANAHKTSPTSSGFNGIISRKKFPSPTRARSASITCASIIPMTPLAYPAPSTTNSATQPTKRAPPANPLSSPTASSSSPTSNCSSCPSAP